MKKLVIFILLFSNFVCAMEKEATGKYVEKKCMEGIQAKAEAIKSVIKMVETALFAVQKYGDEQDKEKLLPLCNSMKEQLSMDNFVRDMIAALFNLVSKQNSGNVRVVQPDVISLSDLKGAGESAMQCLGTLYSQNKLTEVQEHSDEIGTLLNFCNTMKKGSSEGSAMFKVGTVHIIVIPNKKDQ